jgi:hypothetical protein
MSKGKVQADGTVCHTGPGCKRHSGNVSKTTHNVGDSIKHQLSAMKKFAKETEKAVVDEKNALRDKLDAILAEHAAKPNHKPIPETMTHTDEEVQANVRKIISQYCLVDFSDKVVEDVTSCINKSDGKEMAVTHLMNQIGLSKSVAYRVQHKIFAAYDSSDYSIERFGELYTKINRRDLDKN